MKFDSFTAFLHMGGYAFYVWSSFALAALVLGWVMLQPLRRHRQLLRTQACLLERSSDSRTQP